MEKLILPDSNVYIDALRAGSDPFQSFSRHLDTCEFATCGMIMLEVCRGLRELRFLHRFRERFSVMIYLPTTQAIWERAQQIAWAMDRRGQTIPSQDHIIAATALQVGATVLTRDRHFSLVPDLKVMSDLY
ncbi:MAG: PIN domain-containing protein [Opitutaceae bacterium]|nr:PIN domain-containing protein [Opitutaceae bacterium]